MVALILLINSIAVTIINHLIGIFQMRIFLYYKSQFSNFSKCKVDILICIYKLKRHLKRISTLKFGRDRICSEFVILRNLRNLFGNVF